MPKAKPAARLPLRFIAGDDEFSVKRRAQEILQEWSAARPRAEAETIDGAAANAGEATRALARLFEALQTLPLFGEGKIVWFQNCNFLGEDRTASSAAVTESLQALGEALPRLLGDSVSLLITAGKTDRRKSFYKTIEKLGETELLQAMTTDDRDWEMHAGLSLRRELESRGKRIRDDARAHFVHAVGPNQRQITAEAEKLALYVGAREEITAADVEAIVTHQRHARAFALADAFGDRDLPRLLRLLQDELWGLRLDPQKSEIGLLYGLIAKTRVLLWAKALLAEGIIKSDADFTRFKQQLERVPADGYSADKRLNPLAVNPYLLFKSLPQTRKWQANELIGAMDRLLRCNRQLVGSGLEASVVLQQTLVQIVQTAGTRRGHLD